MRKMSFVQIPANIPRFFEIEREDSLTLIPIEEVIRENLISLFRNVEIESVSLFRITRNGDFTLEESDDMDANFLEEVKRKLMERKTGRAGLVQDDHIQFAAVEVADDLALACRGFADGIAAAAGRGDAEGLQPVEGGCGEHEARPAGCGAGGVENAQQAGGGRLSGVAGPRSRDEAAATACSVDGAQERHAVIDGGA
jgi:hypothetical protein